MPIVTADLCYRNYCEDYNWTNPHLNVTLNVDEREV